MKTSALMMNKNCSCVTKDLMSIVKEIKGGNVKDIWIGIENAKQNEIRNISKDFKDILMSQKSSGITDFYRN